MEVLSCFESYCDGCSKCEPKITHEQYRRVDDSMSNRIKVYCKYMDVCKSVADNLKGRLSKNVNN